MKTKSNFPQLDIFEFQQFKAKIERYHALKEYKDKLQVRQAHKLYLKPINRGVYA